jgi:poly [ADP-ribose] polymerase
MIRTNNGFFFEHDKSFSINSSICFFLNFCKGRIGTNFGGKIIEEYKKQSKAIDAFHKVFSDKTGNQWTDRGMFKKLPNKLYPLEIDYGQHGDSDQLKKALNDPNSKIGSLLPESVQDLIRLIFNVKTMEKTLLSFEIDLTKMPLGKLSRNQLNMAYQILTKLQTLITKDSTKRTSIIDASNRFYTLIPHDFGLARPKILDNIDLIQSKTQMIDNLLEIEIAYSMLKGSQDEQNEHPIDVHYKKLKSIIEPIDKNTEEFKRIEQYMINTHASTHKQYTLKLNQLFKIIRQGEYDRFQKWEKLPNRQLLWHGSRTTNFAGILSQGLRIAPPEAPMVSILLTE